MFRERTRSIIHGVCGTEFRELGKLSIPLCAIYASDIGMYMIDMAVVGRLGVAELAGVAIAEQLVFLTIGVLHSVVALFVVAISNAVGEGDRERVLRLFIQGLCITIVCGAGGMLFVWNLASIFALLGHDGTILRIAESYSRAVMWCMIPYLLFLLARGFLAAIDSADLVFPVVVAAVALNVPLSYGFTFGALGLPQLGVAGAGVSTSIVTCFMLCSLLRPIAKWIGADRSILRRCRPFSAGQECFSTIKGGGRAALSTLLEDGLFVVIGALAASLGAAPLAAHYLANSFANLSMVFASGVGDAASIRIAVCRGRRESLSRVSSTALAIALPPIALISVAMAFFPEHLARLFIGSSQRQGAEFLNILVPIFILAAITQLLEGAQVVAIRALRGLEDTTRPLLVSLTGYWVIAFPLALVLAYPVGLGIAGVWLAMMLGLAFASTMLVLRLYRLCRDPISSVRDV
ncbi:MATE family efflux transporter [Stenotrophomonas maltophilia]|uniref:MATE family efflux transporter n=1 Tax=Stenotrophomonas maltophilia TaxID=40324 RepID=UPI0034DAE7ED